MGRALCLHTREAILAGYAQSETFSSLSLRLGVSYSAVRKLCKLYDQVGDSCLMPSYDRCGDRLSRYRGFVQRASCFLKYYHRNWGAEYILARIRRKYPDLSLPSARTLQRWFKAKGLNKSRPAFRDRSSDQEPIPKADRVHHIWQVDAKEHQQTSDRTDCCYLNFTDEYSGAVLGAVVFPLQADLPSSN